LETGAYSDAKAKLAASKVDYEEALKLLNNATTDYDAEKDAIRTAKVVCSYSLDSIAAFQNLIVCSEHLDKVSAYVEGDDTASMRSELKLAEDALDDALPLISAAKEKCFSIDVDTVPVESKSELLEDRISIEQSEKIILEFGVLISGMHPYIDGMEHMLKASKYMGKEEWHGAELEFSKCPADFSESKDIIADPAISIYGILTKMLEALPHFEAGCRYADRGNFKKAEEEFNKIPAF
jgi:tetratricopeptide (TPR) repeat protein